MSQFLENDPLRESAPFTRGMLNALPLAACLIDHHGRVLMANDACWHMLPQRVVPQRDILDANVFVLFAQLNCFDPALARFTADLREMLAGRANGAMGEYMCTSEGRQRWYEVRANRLADDAAGRVLLTHADISARRATEACLAMLEARLDEAVKTRTTALQRQIDDLEAFCRSVAHDLRNPLFVVTDAARALLHASAPVLSREVREDLRRIECNARQMGDMLAGLHALAQTAGEAPVREAVDLEAMTREIFDTLSCRYRYRRVAVTLGELPPVRSDSRLLRVVMQNLIENAWKYTSRTPQAAIEVGSTRESDGSITHFVRDNGVGLAPGALDSIFLPFKRLASARGFAGSGIGLATVKRVIDRLDGRVWAHSAPGEGTTFFFQLGTGAD